MRLLKAIWRVISLDVDIVAWVEAIVVTFGIALLYSAITIGLPMLYGVSFDYACKISVYIIVAIGLLLVIAAITIWIIDFVRRVHYIYKRMEEINGNQ